MVKPRVRENDWTSDFHLQRFEHIQSDFRFERLVIQTIGKMASEFLPMTLDNPP